MVRHSCITTAEAGGRHDSILGNRQRGTSPALVRARISLMGLLQLWGPENLCETNLTHQWQPYKEKDVMGFSRISSNRIFNLKQPP